jgi:hypothetical protein
MKYYLITNKRIAAVLLAEQPEPSVSLPLIDKLAKSLSIEVQSNSLQPLSSFLGQLDKNKRLQATLVKQPKVSTTQPQSIDQDINSGAPTNAVWFIVKPDSYQVIYVLSYVITGADTLLSDALNWIALNFDAFAPNLKIKTPPVNLTLKRIKTYSVKNTQTDEPNVITSLSFAFDISSFRLYLDLSSIDREIILTPKDGKPIVEMIKDIFGDKQDVGEEDIDMSLLPNAEGSDPFASIFDNVHLWYVRLRYDGLQPKKRRLQWGIGVLAFWKPKEDIHLATLLTYDSLSKLFVGRLMFEQDFQTAMDLRSPAWDPRLSPSPILNVEGLKPKDFNRSLDLWKLVGFDSASQPPIPTKLQNVQVTFQGSSDTNTGSVFTFMADLVRDDNPQAERAGGAPSGFKWDTASLDLLIVSPKAKTSAKSYAIDVSIVFSRTLTKSSMLFYRIITFVTSSKYTMTFPNHPIIFVLYQNPPSIYICKPHNLS